MRFFCCWNYPKLQFLAYVCNFQNASVRGSRLAKFDFTENFSFEGLKITNFHNVQLFKAKVNPSKLETLNFGAYLPLPLPIKYNENDVIAKHTIIAATRHVWVTLL